MPNVDVEIINWALIAATPTRPDKPVAPARRQRQPEAHQQRRIYWGQSRKSLSVACYRREALCAGDAISGPALIIENQTTTLVSPGFDALVDRVGNLVLTSKRSQRGNH